MSEPSASERTELANARHDGELHYGKLSHKTDLTVRRVQWAYEKAILATDFAEIEAQHEQLEKVSSFLKGAKIFADVICPEKFAAVEASLSAYLDRMNRARQVQVKLQTAEREKIWTDWSDLLWNTPLDYGQINEIVGMFQEKMTLPETQDYFEVCEIIASNQREFTEQLDKLRRVSTEDGFIEPQKFEEELAKLRGPNLNLWGYQKTKENLYDLAIAAWREEP